MTADGKGNTLVWAGENRLVEWLPAAPSAGHKRVVNTYDGQSRRVRKQVYEWSIGWQLTKDEVFLYDGWNPVAIYTLLSSSFTLDTSLTWGRDLSGSDAGRADLQGAGGVGGLLATYDGTIDAGFFYDANGNVGQLLDAGTSNTIAAYEYDPFGNLVTSTGTYAETNPYRFSTKFFDEETEYYYYGYRFYNPETGRWPNRDPIEEQGGVNLYAVAQNNPINFVDILGKLIFATDDYSSGFHSEYGWEAIVVTPNSIEDHIGEWMDVSNDNDQLTFFAFTGVRTAAVAIALKRIRPLGVSLATSSGIAIGMSTLVLQVKAEGRSVEVRQWRGVVEHHLNFSGYHQKYRNVSLGQAERRLVELQSSYRVVCKATDPPLVLWTSGKQLIPPSRTAEDFMEEAQRSPFPTP